MGAAHGRDSLGRDTEEALRTAAAFRSRIATVRLDVTLGLKTVQRGIYGADGHLTVGAQFNLLPYGDPIGLICQAKKCQDNDVLKFAEVIAISHILYNIDQIVFEHRLFLLGRAHYPQYGVPVDILQREIDQVCLWIDGHRVRVRHLKRAE